MSDNAMKGDESEVLASIRRLVSNAPSAARARASSAKPDPMIGSEKLLLTPSLRVAPPPVATPASGTTPEPQAPKPGDSELPNSPAAKAEDAWSLEDRIAELEAAVSSVPGEWEPDGSEDADQETPRRFVFQHRPLPLGGREIEPPKLAETVAPAASADPLEAPGAKAGEPVVDTGFDLDEAETIDEEMLRDLVSEIVRQELQGELGQRVTRNIRKLVRREIHRVLMSRDFD